MEPSPLMCSNDHRLFSRHDPQECPPGLLIAAISAITGIAHAGETPLPDIGSSAGTVASPEESARRLHMLHELRNQNVVLEDELLNDYVNTLGFAWSRTAEAGSAIHVLSRARQPDQRVCVPGGFVGVNTGLILMTRTRTNCRGARPEVRTSREPPDPRGRGRAEDDAADGAGDDRRAAAAAHQNPYSTSNADMGAIATVQVLPRRCRSTSPRRRNRSGPHRHQHAGQGELRSGSHGRRVRKHAAHDSSDIRRERRPALLQDHRSRPNASARRAHARRASRKPRSSSGVEDKRRKRGRAGRHRARSCPDCCRRSTEFGRRAASLADTPEVARPPAHRSAPTSC